MFVTPDNEQTDAGTLAPRRAMQVVAEMLAARGLDTSSPGHTDSRLLTVTAAAGARCEVHVEDDQAVSCAYHPAASHSGAAPVAGAVLRLLGARDDTPAGAYARLHRGATLKGAVGRELTARGLTVRLSVVRDEDFFDATANVLAASPARPERGVVYVADDGPVLWECQASALPGGLADIADTITGILTS